MSMGASHLEVEPGKRRPWRGKLLACCGDCGPLDCVSCVLGCNAPWAAFGWNVHKVLQRAFWREAGIALAFTIIGFTLYEGASISLQFACVRALDADGQVYCASMRNGVAVTSLLLLLAALATWVGYGVFMGGRRGLLRSKLDIEQGGCNDVAAHLFCNTCAVIQETRTIMHMEAEGLLARKLVGDATYHLLAPLNDDGMDREPV